MWQRSKKCCIKFKSDSDAPYTERQYVKFGRTNKDLNKWSISTWEYCSFLRDLKTCKNLFALTNFSLTCSLNLQLLWRVTTSNDRLLHCRILQICTYAWFSHDVTKMQTKKLSILPRFYFHDALEQLKTNFHTNFRFKRVLGFVIEYAWISKLLRDAAFTWRPRELSCRLKKWLILGNFAI